MIPHFFTLNQYAYIEISENGKWLEDLFIQFSICWAFVMCQTPIRTEGKRYPMPSSERSQLKTHSSAKTLTWQRLIYDNKNNNKKIDQHLLRPD